MANNINTKEITGDLVSLNKQLKETTSILGQLISKQQTLNKEIGSAKGLKQVNDSLNKSKKTSNDIEKEAEKLINKTNQLKIKQAQSLKAANKEYIKQNEKVKEQNRLLREQAKSDLGIKKRGGLFKSMTKSILAATSAMLGFQVAIKALKNVINVVKEYGSALSSLKAITGASAKDMAFFAAASVRTAGKTLQSATDILKAYEKVGSASPILLKNARALAAVTESAIVLSEATGGKLALEGSVDAVTAAMNQFDIPANKAKDIINTLAAGSLEGSANVAEMTESFKGVGTVAKASNLSLEQTVAALEVLASKQLKGAEAGTALRGTLLRLRKAGLGYASGQFVLNDAIDEANKNLASMGSNLKKDAYLSKIFGDRNIVAGSILLENKDKYNELTKAVTGTNTALEQQSIQNDNLKGDIDGMKSSWESFILGLNGSDGVISKVFRNIVKWVNAVVVGLDRINKTDHENNLADTYDGASAAVEDFANQVERSSEDIIASNKILIDGANEYLLTLDKSSPAYDKIVNKTNQLIEQNKLLSDSENDKQRKINAYNKKIDETFERMTNLNKLASDSNNDRAKQDAILAAFAENELEMLNAKLTALYQVNEVKKEETLATKEQSKAEKETVSEVKKSKLELISIEQKANIKFREIEDEKYNIVKENIARTVLANQEKLEQIEADEKASEERKKAIRQEFISSSVDLGNTLFDLGQAQRSRELSEIQNNYQARIEAAEGDSELQKKLALQLEQEQKRINREQAKSEKNQALFNIAIKTAENIVKYTGGLPFTAPLLALAITTGAAQAALVSSQPLPGFFKGTENAPEGLAWIAERGAELLETPSGESMLVKSPTIMNLEAGTKVKTAEETTKLLNKAIYNDIAISGNSTIDTDRIVSAIKNKPEPAITWNERGLQISVRQGNALTHYMNKKGRK